MLFKMAAQASFRFRTWGGKRKGAGRPRKDGTVRKRGMPHLPRVPLAKRFPVHVTWRMQPGVWSLRTRRCFTVLKRAMYQGASRFGFRLVHYAVMGNHIHLLVEAVDRRALARGMQGLGVRIARGLNAVMRRSGRVVLDRYHAHILRTPTEARHARTYLLQNARRHYGVGGADRYTSTVAVVEPETFLMRRLC
jgi:hypothetical protein